MPPRPQVVKNTSRQVPVAGGHDRGLNWSDSWLKETGRPAPYVVLTGGGPLLYLTGPVHIRCVHVGAPREHAGLSGPHDERTDSRPEGLPRC